MRDYVFGSHTTRVMEASKAARSAHHVLCAMCAASEYSKPEVTITKPQLVKKTRYTEKTVKKAIKDLLAEGSIEVVANGQGGRGIAPTYRLVVIGAPSPKYRDTPKQAVEAKRRRIAQIIERDKCGYGVAADKYDAEQRQSA